MPGMKWIEPIVFSKRSGNPIFGQIFGHQRAKNEARNTKMNRGQLTHPIRVNARYEMNWANSFFSSKSSGNLVCRRTDGQADGQTDGQTSGWIQYTSIPPSVERGYKKPNPDNNRFPCLHTNLCLQTINRFLAAMALSKNINHSCRGMCKVIKNMNLYRLLRSNMNVCCKIWLLNSRNVCEMYPSAQNYFSPAHCYVLKVSYNTFITIFETKSYKWPVIRRPSQCRDIIMNLWMKGPIDNKVEFLNNCSARSHYLNQSCVPTSYRGTGPRWVIEKDVLTHVSTLFETHIW